MITLDKFHQDFIQTLLSDSESRGLLKSDSFFDMFCEDLVRSGDLGIDYAATPYKKNGVEVYGSEYDRERKIFTLINFEFFQEDKINTLTKKMLEVKFNRLRKYIFLAKSGLYNDMEETSEGYDLAFNLFQLSKANEIDRFRLIVLTDGRVTRSVSEIPSEFVDGFTYEYRVIDINYLYKIYASQSEGAPYEIDVNIPFLEVDNDSEKYQSYLCILNGEDLFNIYDEYGQKLLEQNVRTFLQFKGAINKGIRNTIEFNPEFFFAYNNGITATATEIIVENNQIKKLVNFQIVNGGQTSSAIYAAKKNNKLDIGKVNVQMKLSVINNNGKQGEFVSKISEYANTQNKVNKSDFFSNSTYHKEMKTLSKIVWAPARHGSQQRTHWYYERVRGEYLNEQAYLTSAERRQYEIMHPKNQKIEKTFLAKSENTWMQKPHIVSKGAQYSFVEFANKVQEEIEDEKLLITEQYFRDCVSRIILFKATEKIISESDWYEGGYRAQIVTYSIAYLSNYLSKNSLWLDFNMIWELQEIPSALADIIKIVTSNIYKLIIEPPPGYKNVGEWCKKEHCWNEIMARNIYFELPKKLTISKQELQSINKEQREIKKIDVGIEAQTFVVTTHLEVWVELLSYYSKIENYRDISITQRDILKKYIEGKLNPPSDRQSKIMFSIYMSATDAGWRVEDVYNL
ncbi:AIPR family protein [Rossellomorea marisflavi]|uniref:AIPR family protein n=1 Tax=Rossellomorea marisflavi TaxID=189381 RepID=UPI00064FC7FE|nr:AIPR family protein [Rossellomorea marisflavi]KML03177.1 abortive phage infection protein [Rossellomorea marisflavi]